MIDKSARKLRSEKVPVIDISQLQNKTNCLDVAKALHQASRNLGFIYIKGHKIRFHTISSLRNQGLEFFNRTINEKLEIKMTTNHRGWLGYGGAKMRENAKPDFKESFVWGYETEKNSIDDQHPLRGKNLWPKFQPKLQKYAMEFFWSADDLARDLLKGFALALNLQEDFFIKTSTNPLSRASLVYYPNQPSNLGDNQFGVSSHTDFGVLTILCQDSVGGLQIQDLDGEWFHAPPIDDTIIVNVGDLLSRWTNGEYRSTPHRVLNNSGKERLSLVLAFDPDPNTIVDPRQIFKTDEIELDAEPISCGEYLNWRFNKAFSYRKKIDS